MENEKQKIAPATIIQRVVSILLAIVTIVFAIWGIDGKNPRDVYAIIVGLGALATTLSELIPFIIKTTKDKNYAEVLSIVRQCVVEVENIEGLHGPEKKAKVLEAVKKLLEEKNITIDISAVDAMIESVVTIMNTIKKGE